MWEFLLSFLGALLSAASLALGVWWAWGRKWHQRRKKEKQQREEREFRAKVRRWVEAEDRVRQEMNEEFDVGELLEGYEE